MGLIDGEIVGLGDAFICLAFFSGGFAGLRARSIKNLGIEDLHLEMLLVLLLRLILTAFGRVSYSLFRRSADGGNAGIDVEYLGAVGATGVLGL